MRQLSTSILLMAIAVAVASCSAEPEQKPPPFQATTTVKNFMLWQVDPAADVVWNSAGYVVTEAGEQSKEPTTEEGWEQVRNAATSVAEAGNLLMMPGYAADQSDWVEYSAGLIQAGIAARQAAEAKDADALFQAGANLYNVCLACHSRYIVQAAQEQAQ